MIRVVLIDDERPALRELEYLLKKDGAFEVVGMFINPLEAVSAIKGLNPQAVFLDIHMPQLKGIDAASQILDRCPFVDVIFVTAYDQYAIEAFELNAMDYVLKPISQKRFAKTLNRIKEGNSRSERQLAGKKLRIHCLGEFQIGWEGQEPIKWRSEKTRELFAYLLHHAGREVTKEKILEAVWNDVDKIRAMHQLHNGIYYIRKTLEQYGIEESRLSVGGGYWLKLGEVEMDYLLLKRDFQSISNGEYNLETLEKTAALYGGDYLEGFDWLWADPERSQLMDNYMEVVLRLSESYLQNKKYNQAEELLLMAFKRNPYLAEITKLLLKLYKGMNSRNKALGHFREYARILKEELAIEPEEELRALLNEFK
jgi:two-component system, LytTR family, response regulator